MKLVIKAANEGELETVATREYDTGDFVVPEPRNVITLGAAEDEEEERYYVQNVVHQLGEDEAQIHLVVQTEEEVMEQVRKQRAQQRQMQQMQKMAQQAQGGGGQGGNDSPFSL